jgi:putative Mg2+ transporter-C (MgtC) family protein
MQALGEFLSQVPVQRFVAMARGDILLHLFAALVAGAAIGAERSFHGRPAGFRTHSLVCLASSLLMLLTVYQQEWFPAVAGDDSVRIDPTRMAQGIMTGIGFLGAGVIFKEGLTVRGLTTAASIWITAAIGVMMGSGLYFPAATATVLTLGVLSVFRVVESWLPAHRYATLRLHFERSQAIPEADLRELLVRQGCTAGPLSWRLADDGRVFEYRMTVRTTDRRNFARVAHVLAALPAVREYTLSPSGE